MNIFTINGDPLDTKSESVKLTNYEKKSSQKTTFRFCFLTLILAYSSLEFSSFTASFSFKSCNQVLLELSFSSPVLLLQSTNLLSII